MVTKVQLERKINLRSDEIQVLSFIYDYFKKAKDWPGVRTTHQKYGRDIVSQILKRDAPVLIWQEKANDSRKTYKLTFEGIYFCHTAKEDLLLLNRFLRFLIEKYKINPEIAEVTGEEVESELQLDKEKSIILMELIKEGHFCSSASFGKEWRIQVAEDIEDLVDLGEEQYILKRLAGLFEKTRRVKFEHINNVNKRLPAHFDWKAIEEEYEVSKKEFGKRISFVSDKFKREIIFRDVEQAYALAKSGFNKPAVILAGSIVEELLRLYLESNELKPRKNSFDDYIKLCEERGLLKLAINRLTDSVRCFRNLVHLENEVNDRHSISKTTATAAVASIFTIANDFNARKS